MAVRTTIHQAFFESYAAHPHRTTDTYDVVRWKLEIIPAEDATLTNTELTRVTLSPDVIMSFAAGDGKFESYPVGAPEAEEMSVKLNYREMPTDLRDWVTTGSGVSVTVGDASFWLSSVWIFSSDHGDTALDPEEFYPVFIGVHYHQNDCEYEFTGETIDSPLVMNLKLRHIGMACLESVTIDMLRTSVIDTAVDSEGKALECQRLYQLIIKKAGHGCTYASAEWTWDTAHRAWILPLVEIYNHIMLQAQVMFRRWLRAPVVADVWATTEAIWENRPGELTWELYKQLHDATRGYGAVLDYEDRECVALISSEASPGDLSSTATTWVGGLLGGTNVGRGSDTFFEFKNCWNFVRALVKGGDKLFFSIDQQSSISHDPGSPVFRMILDCVPIMANGGSTEMPAETLLVSDLLPNWKWHPGEMNARGGLIEVPNVVGLEPSTIEVSTDENFANDEVEFACVVHNLPSLHKLPDSFIDMRVRDNVSELSGTNMVFLVEPQGFTTRAIYYRGTPSGVASTAIAIRASSNCAYLYGPGVTGGVLGSGNEGVRNIAMAVPTATEYNSIAYAGTYGAANPGTRSTYGVMYQLILSALLQERKEYNILVALCTAARKLFARNHASGNPHGTAVLSATVLGFWPASMVGRRIALSSAADSDGFTPEGTGSTLWELTPTQRELIITSLKPDYTTMQSAIEAVATYDDAFWDTP